MSGKVDEQIDLPGPCLAQGRDPRRERLGNLAGQLLVGDQAVSQLVHVDLPQVEMPHGDHVGIDERGDRPGSRVVGPGGNQPAEE